MGWYSIARAIKDGGKVHDILKGEMDPSRAITVALQQIQEQIKSGCYTPDDKAKLRIAFLDKTHKMTK